jgi:hypothetical protein
MKILILFILFIVTSMSYSQDFFISSSGKTYSEARNSASTLIFSQGLRIVGQNHVRDSSGNWNLIFKVRSKNN